MGFEIDYLPVGSSPDAKSGDAIAMRFWANRPEESFIITIDGGTKESGELLCEHIKKYYQSTHVNLAVLTHPDADHASGMREVINSLSVGAILTSKPWEHAAAILPTIQAADSRVTEESIKRRIIEAFPAAYEIATNPDISKKTKIYEPYDIDASQNLGKVIKLTLLGPSREEYETQWLPNYRCMPTQPIVKTGLFEGLLTAAGRTIAWVSESWNSELLSNPADDATSAENNSSLIFSITHNGSNFLFTGDAGVPALQAALNRGVGLGLPKNSFTFFHVPHHGSRRNICPIILDQLFGPAIQTQQPQPVSSKFTAFVSATKDDPKHPSRRVVNALVRRNVKVIVTAGSTKLHHSSESPSRGWTNVSPLGFYDQVEETDD